MAWMTTISGSSEADLQRLQASISGIARHTAMALCE
jgi:hypothetical protein